MSEENQKLKENLFNYFAEENIEVNEEIKQCFDDVFDQFEFISHEDDDVNIYMEEDVIDFESDLTMRNAFNIVVDGISSGVYQSSYTYYGDIQYVTNETTDLMYKNEVIEKLIDFNYDAQTKIKNTKDWVITVIETITWQNGDYMRIPKLYIYCPYKGRED